MRRTSFAKVLEATVVLCPVMGHDLIDDGPRTEWTRRVFEELTITARNPDRKPRDRDRVKSSSANYC